jgi:uncharacterized protein (DUF2147 family)
MMCRATTLAALAILGGATLGTSRAWAADDPAGYWATEKNESQIHITHCGTDKLCGSVFWMKTPSDAKGNLKLDKENEDESKRKRPLLGIQLINMKPDDENWKGTVYNPTNGKTYDATLKMLGKNQVELKGCVAYILCGGQKWVREEPKTVGAADAVHPAVTTPPAHKAGTVPTSPASETATPPE